MSNTMKELLAGHISRQQAITQAAESEQRELTAAEQNEFEFLQRSIDAINSQLDEGKSGERGAENQPEDGERGIYSKEEISEINSICRSFGMESGECFEKGMTIEDVRKAALDKAVNEKKPIGARIYTDESGEDAYRHDMSDGIILRSGISVKNASDGAKKLKNMNLRDVAIDCLSRMSGSADEYRRMSSDELFGCIMREYFNPSNAFPAIMDAAIQKSYVNAWEMSGTTFDRWVKKGTLSDFKESKNSEYIAGFGGEFEKVAENGELKAHTPTDAKMPKRKLETYGRQFTMTRQAFINDDIGMVTTMPARFAEMAKQTQNRQCYDILINNRKIHDGKVLFGADHKNVLDTGTGITKDALQKMIYLLGKQTDLAGNPILVNPNVLIVPLGYGMDAEVLLKSPVIEFADNTQAINPFAGKNWDIVEDVTMNNLLKEGEALPFFLGVKERILQIDYLNGQEIPTIRRSETPGTLGFVWDIYLDWGISDLGWQGIVKNPGIELSI